MSLYHEGERRCLILKDVMVGQLEDRISYYMKPNNDEEWVRRNPDFPRPIDKAINDLVLFHENYIRDILPNCKYESEAGKYLSQIPTDDQMRIFIHQEMILYPRLF